MNAVASLLMWLGLFLLSVFSFSVFANVLFLYEQDNGFDLWHGDVLYYLLLGGVLYSCLGGLVAYVKMEKAFHKVNSLESHNKH